VFDGWVLSKNPFTAYASGQQHHVPMIVGSTLNEGTFYLANEKDLTLKRYEDFMRARFADRTNDAMAMFPARDDADVPRAIDHFITVAVNAEPARFVAEAVAKAGGKAYIYQFTRRPQSALARKMAVHHGVDLAYVFGNMDEPGAYDGTDHALAEAVMSYWTNFAKTGDPNGVGLQAWPAHDSASDLHLELGGTVAAGRHLYKAECDFINSVSQYRRR
jgi:para-nitrobenzyl esterase